DVLPAATAVMSHGGAGLTQAAMIVGRPQIILPIHFESEATAGRLESLGVGKGIRSANADDLKNAISAVLEVRRFGENAQALASKISDMKLPDSATRLVAQRVMEHLENRS
ncbi:MAG: nucleotide disphospho-sugar-binding domain-containing protein, partial [Hyphomicrobiales bacterium]